jgi:hypothetical protein
MKQRYVKVFKLSKKNESLFFGRSPIAEKKHFIEENYWQLGQAFRCKSALVVSPRCGLSTAILNAEIIQMIFCSE